jgi:hypothetical protein
MSQLFFKTEYKGEKVTVMTGFDRPCNHYFYTVFKDDVEEDEDDVLWSSMDNDPASDSAGGYPTVGMLLERVMQNELPQPPDTANWASLILLNEGNVRYRYDNGWPKAKHEQQSDTPTN